jgi:glycerol-3-phosphate dehydrogenase (NAD(P)+)
MLAGAGHPVTLWSHDADAAAAMRTAGENSRYLPGATFPPGLTVTGNDADLDGPHLLLVAAVPSEHLRATLSRLSPVLNQPAPVLSVVKGIEAHSQRRMSEVIAEVLPDRAVAALSGPNLAREIAAGQPAGTVVASADHALADEVAILLGSDRFRVYTSTDVTGVELAGSLKNVVALAAGMADGLALGDSGKASIITRGLAEITRLGVAAGARPETFAGLAGVGDLIATCMSDLSRNRRAGELLASGLPWSEVAGRLNGVAEGAATVTGALELAARLGVEMPIAEQAAAVVRGERVPLDALAQLMARAQRDELRG